jgi:hypothetical protein
MQDPVIQDNKQESRLTLSVELINGYYLSFLGDRVIANNIKR